MEPMDRFAALFLLLLLGGRGSWLGSRSLARSRAHHRLPVGHLLGGELGSPGLGVDEE